MPPFEVGNALKSGVVDIANVTGAFYTNVIPEVGCLEAHAAADGRAAQERRLRLHGQALRREDERHLPARQIGNTPFHVYLTKPITKPDLTGLKIRITPVYRDFFTALGATVVQTAPGEVYTALERGVVDGYGWPIRGIFDLGWHEKTKYRVDPGFYTAEVSFLINKTTWGKLERRATQGDRRRGGPDRGGVGRRFEAGSNTADIERQKQAGIQTIEFKGAEGEAYLAKAYEAGWAGIIKQSPEHGPKLREFFAKAK